MRKSEHLRASCGLLGARLVWVSVHIFGVSYNPFWVFSWFGSPGMPDWVELLGRNSAHISPDLLVPNPMCSPHGCGFTLPGHSGSKRDRIKKEQDRDNMFLLAPEMCRFFFHF